MDVKRIETKLDELMKYVEELEEDIPATEEGYLESRIIRRACEKSLEIAIETVIDIANLIITGKRLGKPADNKDSIKKLEQNKILNKKLSSNLQEMVSFRNLLVHRYARIDDSRVYEYLKNNLNDFTGFVTAVESFINK